MKTPKIFQFLLVLATSLLLGFSPALMAKGPPAKVEVLGANPADASQGQELDVTITGSGFDNGSSASFLVTGTTDASQVDVLSVQYVSGTELKAHIKVKDAALVNDYDIEVQTLSGRKGKGTTLFRVKVAEVACTGEESKLPTIAYKTEFITIGDLNTADIYLSSESGCDEYLLVPDADLFLTETRENADQDRHFRSVRDIRIAYASGQGFVTWRDSYQTPFVQMGIFFEFDEETGNVIVDPLGPQLVHRSDERRNTYSDVRFNSQGEVELAVAEIGDTSLGRRLMMVNLQTGVQTELITEACPIQDERGDCFEIVSPIYWNAQGDEIFFGLRNSLTSYDKNGVARISVSTGDAPSPQPVMFHDNLNFRMFGPSNDGLLLYHYWEPLTNKSGKQTGWRRAYGLIDPSQCEARVCSTKDGLDLNGIDPREHGARTWTRSGGILFFVTQEGPVTGVIRDFPNPLDFTSSRIVLDGADSDVSAVRQ